MKALKIFFSGLIGILSLMGVVALIYIFVYGPIFVVRSIGDGSMSFSLFFEVLGDWFVAGLWIVGGIAGTTWFKKKDSK